MAENAQKLAGKRINLVMEFNAVNGWFAMALYKMGARIKWASNDRAGRKTTDSLAVMQAVAIMSNGAIEPYMAKKNKSGEDPLVSYWTSVIRSLIWKEDDGLQFADFIFDSDGLA